MTLQKAGTSVEYTITYLEMTARPRWDYPAQPSSLRGGSLQKADKPPLWYFFSVYDAVGGSYEWVDQHAEPPDEVRAWLHADTTELYTLFEGGWPNGFFMLDQKVSETCELAYFGLVPEALGKGIGTWFLKTAVLAGWDRPGTQRMTVQTCTLDHPRALALYQKCGFTPFGQEIKSRVLTRDRHSTPS